MTTTISAADQALTEPAYGKTDWLATARALGPGFASRAAAYDANDSFGIENYRELKAHRFFGAVVPAKLGGGGASYGELCSIVRELGRHCGATALSLSMHMHLTGTVVWLWRHGAPVAPVLERIAREQLVLVTSGATDWLDSGGTAERVDGGYKVTARKAFCSGSPAGDLLITSAVVDDPTEMWQLLGELENALVTGELAVQSSIELCADYAFAPEDATANGMFIRKTIAAQALTLAVEKAMEVVGGAGIYRSLGLERLVRDIHAAQFHPLQTKRQHRFTGRMALGLHPIG